MTQIRTATRDEYLHLIDFANRQFNENFTTIVPKLYAHSPEKAMNHLLFLDDGELQGLLGAFPMQWQCGDTTLKYAGIGTVCVVESARKLGVMSQLFATILPQLQAHQFDFAILGGQRQRYEPWGFTPSGTQYQLAFTSDNARHFRGDECACQFVRATPSDSDLYQQAVALHQIDACFTPRVAESFLTISHTWENQLYWVFSPQQTWLGYLIVSPDHTEIIECSFTVQHLRVAIIYAWIREWKLPELKLTSHFGDPALTDSLAVVEEFTIKSNTNLLIFNFMRMIQATLTLKAKTQPLLSGQVVIQIDNQVPLEICVDAQGVHVRETAQAPTVHFTALEATRVLFSPHAVVIQNPVLAAWLPLPFFISPVDTV